MKKIGFLFLLLMIGTANVYARMLPENEKTACEKLLKLAENKQIDGVYDICGFNDEGAAWYQWAPLMSAAENKKALYELCKRFPTHDYAHLYCQKSADLNYIPAFYRLAKEAEEKKENGLYKEYLEKIVEQNDIRNKKRLTTEEDFVTRQAYEDLAKIYLNSSVDKDREKGLQYLQIAADAGDSSAAHTLGVLLYWNQAPEQQALSKKYLWKAILSGCPAAEENLGLMGYLEQGRLYLEDARESIESHLYTCQATQSDTASWDKILKVEDCACPDVLDWFKRQKKKPFLVIRLADKSAVLKDPEGNTYPVVKGDKIGNGFVVEDVRSSAVIVRRLSERYVLQYRTDTQCVDLCFNPNVIPKHFVKDLPAYELTFTKEECENLAAGIENLNNPMSAFRGLPECQLQDWARWGEQALDENRNKHLFLLANYEKSDYLPSFVVQAEQLIGDGIANHAGDVEKLLTKAIQSKASDELSAIKKEQAYCLLTKLYMDAKLYKKANSLAKKGIDEKYPQSANMRAVLYAKGWGVEKDLEKAKELFLQADEFSTTPFIDARQNYQNLIEKEDEAELIYGQCRDIIRSQSVPVEKLLELY
ncbi:MAG: SEL1-like repeat protein [Alphaproteobacteria bacterium]|nr:SEL1-like repeat protein [Alphaproteobacteria bacterium]